MAKNNLVIEKQRIASNFSSEITKARREWSKKCVVPAGALLNVDSTQINFFYPISRTHQQ